MTPLWQGQFTTHAQEQHKVQDIDHGDYKRQQAKRYNSECCHNAHCDFIQHLVEESEVGATPDDALLQGLEGRVVQAADMTLETFKGLIVFSLMNCPQIVHAPWEFIKKEEEEKSTAEEREDQEGEGRQEDQSQETEEPCQAGDATRTRVKRRTPSRRSYEHAVSTLEV